LCDFAGYRFGLLLLEVGATRVRTAIFSPPRSTFRFVDVEGAADVPIEEIDRFFNAAPLAKVNLTTFLSLSRTGDVVIPDRVRHVLTLLLTLFRHQTSRAWPKLSIMSKVSKWMYAYFQFLCRCIRHN
jgi:hypothetical protein